jgi:transcriptional regulator with XRE-family HTH domain
MKTNTNSPAQSNQLNGLWQGRHRAGLERKQVAFLLSKKSTDELSRYERGIYPPNLKTALRLEIIYQMPVRLLFRELFEQLRTEINEIKAKHPLLLPNGLEIETITKHIIALGKTVSDYKQDRQSFADQQSAQNKPDL